MLQGAPTIEYFFGEFSSMALKLENVGPPFPRLTKYPSNQGQENEVVNIKFWLLFQFICNKDTFLVLKRCGIVPFNFPVVMATHRQVACFRRGETGATMCE